MKPKNPWASAHVRLRRIYDARIGDRTQRQFGLASGIGSQSMVAQYLTGARPLNIEAAAKFAKALGCTIGDISPEMAAALQRDILPVVGRNMLKAAIKAVVAMILVVPPLLPQRAEAAEHNLFSSRFVSQVIDTKSTLCDMLRRAVAWFMSHFRAESYAATS